MQLFSPDEMSSQGAAGTTLPENTDWLHVASKFLTRR